MVNKLSSCLPGVSCYEPPIAIGLSVLLKTG